MKVPARSPAARHRPVEHGGKRALGLEGVIDFSSSMNPLGCPASVMAGMQRGIKGVQHYPDPRSLKLLSSLKKYTRLPESRLLVGNGAVEIIYNFCSRIIPGKRALVPVPTFQEYEAALLLSGCRPEFFKTMSLEDDADPFIRQIPRHGCVFVCNPNNPTGTLLSKGQMIRIVEAAKRRSSFVFADECFIEMARGCESVLRHVTKHDNLFVLRSLTKSFAIPGVRIGYAAGPPDMVRILNDTKVPWSISSVAQDAGVAALKPSGFLSKSNRMIQQEYLFLKDSIDRLDGFRCLDSSANYILIESKYDSTVLQRRLLKSGILVRDCKNFRGLSDRFIRVAIRRHGENLKLVRALEAIR